MFYIYSIYQHVLKVVEFQQDTGQSLTARPCMGMRKRTGERGGGEEGVYGVDTLKMP